MLDLDPVWPDFLHPDAVGVITQEIRPVDGFHRPLRRRLISYFGPHPAGLFVTIDTIAVELAASRSGTFLALKDLVARRVLIALHRGRGRAPSGYRVNPNLSEWDVTWSMPVIFVWALADRQARLRALDAFVVSRKTPVSRDIASVVSRETARIRDTTTLEIRSVANNRHDSRHNESPLSRKTRPIRDTTPSSSPTGGAPEGSGGARSASSGAERPGPDVIRAGELVRQAAAPDPGKGQWMANSERDRLAPLVDKFGVDEIARFLPHRPPSARVPALIDWLEDVLALGDPTEFDDDPPFDQPEFGPSPAALPEYVPDQPVEAGNGLAAIAAARERLRAGPDAVTGVGHNGHRSTEAAAGGEW